MHADPIQNEIEAKGLTAPRVTPAKTVGAHEVIGENTVKTIPLLLLLILDK